MSTQFSAAPDSDDLAEQLPGEAEGPGRGLDEPMRNPILCCGTLYTTSRAFWEHYFTHDE